MVNYKKRKGFNMALLSNKERTFKEQLAFMLNISLDCITNNKRNNNYKSYEDYHKEVSEFMKNKQELSELLLNYTSTSLSKLVSENTNITYKFIMSIYSSSNATKITTDRAKRYLKIIKGKNA